MRGRPCRRSDLSSNLTYPILGKGFFSSLLRDIRDGTAREDRRWREVAFAGLGTADHAIILIQHPGIDRDDLWARLDQRLPNIVVRDPSGVEPSSRLSVVDAARLAVLRRGVQPLRVMVLQQNVAACDLSGEPMPFLAS
jgi:hypothetical protein